MISESDRWLGVELRHFAALQAVASEGSFRRAAEYLGYTQSAISQQIAALERMVDQRLIDRPGGPRAVSLTEAGTLLLRHAEVILARLHAARADLTALSEGAGGSLRIGTYQSVSRRILPALMREFTMTWPQVEVRLTEMVNDHDLLPLIERGELDLCCAICPVPPGPFEAVELLCDPYVLVVAAGAPLAGKKRPLRLKDVADLPLIGFRQCRSAEQAEVHLRARGFEPKIVFRSDDNGTIQGLVAAGIGAALVPRLSVDEGDGEIVVIELADEIPPRRIGIAWHRDRYRSPAALAFIETMQRICARLAPESDREDVPA